LDLIIKYCEYFNFEKADTDIENPLISKDPKIFIKNDWEREFILSLSFDQTCELVMAANFFDIPSIFELCLAQIASFFKNKTFD
jgi:hypothetical protein